MPLNKIIKSEQIVSDIKGGMRGHQLKAKYGLGSPELGLLLGCLINAELLTKDELEDPRQFSESQMFYAFAEPVDGGE